MLALPPVGRPRRVAQNSRGRSVLDKYRPSHGRRGGHGGKRGEKTFKFLVFSALISAAPRLAVNLTVVALNYAVFRVDLRDALWHNTAGPGVLPERGALGGRRVRRPVFRVSLTSSIGIDEGIVKSASESVTLGVGIRVIAGERTGYAYSDDLSPEKIRKAARVAALIAPGPASVVKTDFNEGVQTQSVSDDDVAQRPAWPSASIW